MESKNKSLVPELKMKLNGITHYLYLSERGKDYLLLLSATNQLSIFAAQNFELLSRFTINIAKPIKLVVDGQNNVILIDSAGLCVWTVSQIISKCHPQKIRYEWPSKPLQLVPLGHEEYLVVCNERKLVFLGRQGEQREGSYIQEFVMEDLQHMNLYTTQDHLFVMVPSRAHNYPYVFTRAEVKKWESAGFQERYYKACRNYYMEDEVLNNQEYRMSMAPEMKIVCVIAPKELRILEWRSHSEIGLVLSRRISIVAPWHQCPYSCTISGKTGEVAYASKEKVGIIHPLEYSILKRSVKQKTQPFNWIKHSGNLMLMVSHIDYTKPFRAFLVSLLDS